MLKIKILFSIFILLIMYHSTFANNRESEVLSIRIGIEVNKVPYSYKNMNGKVQGITMDLLDILCKRIQAKCLIMVDRLDVLTNKLAKFEIDAIITTNEDLKENKKDIWSSKALCILEPVYITRKNNLIKTHKLPIGYFKKSQYSYLLKNKKSEYKGYSSIEAAFVDLVINRIDNILTTKATAIYFLKKFSDKYKINTLNIDNYKEMKIVGYDSHPKWLSKFNSVIKSDFLTSPCSQYIQ